VLRYFRDWSESSPANFALYQRFAAAFDKAFPQLVRLFQRSHGLSRPEAEEIARFSLSLVLDRAASSFPHDLLAPVYPLVASIRDGSFKPDDFTASTSYFGEPELYQALIAALVRGLPPAAIEAIAARMDLSDPAAFGESQESLLSFATGDTRSLEILLRRGYPVDTANEFGKTALFYAIGFSQHDAVRVLLAHGANVNHAYKSAKELRPDGDECFYADLKHTRRTPLMHAAQNSDLAMVKLLLEAGGDPDATDDLGSNAMDFAAMGHNPEIVEYLKTQGLAYGSPKYSAEASPEIEERKLISTFPMPGTVSKLLTVPGRPDVLLAGVRPAGHPTVAGKPGIYLVSVADPAHPAVLSMIPDLYTMDFAMTADGRRAYVMGNGNLGGAPERKYGVAVLDIGDPRAPRILEWIDGDFMAMQLAIDDHTLFLQERDHPPQISRGLLVYDLGGPSPRLQCANPFPSPSAGQRLFAYNFAQTPGQPRLFIADQSGFLMLFDVSHPCEPAKVAAFQNVKPSDLTIDPAGTLVVLTDGLSRYRIDGDLTRVNGYRGNFNPLAANAKTRTVAAGVMADSSQFDVVVFQDGPNGQLVLSQRFRTVDDRWIESLHLSDTGYLYMGWEEGLGIGRIRLP
jgi:hypothetical protein